MEHAAPPLSRVSADEQAVIQSVVYSSLFQYPLKPGEVSFSLVGSRLSGAEVVSLYRRSPVLQSVLAFREGCLFLRDQEGHLAERRRREELSYLALDRHRRVIKWIGALPYTRLIALSGGSAHFNLSEEGDIDLFIITRGTRVWSTAVNILLMSRILGCRKMLCFNYLIADSQLALRERDLFSANQTIHLRPLSGAEWMEKLFDANKWIKDMYSNSFPIKTKIDGFDPSPWATRLKKWKEIVLSAGPAQFYEMLCRWTYRRYLLWKSPNWRTPEQVTLDRDVIKLHTQSHSRVVMQRYHLEMERVMGQLSATESST